MVLVVAFKCLLPTQFILDLFLNVVVPERVGDTSSSLGLKIFCSGEISKGVLKMPLLKNEQNVLWWNDKQEK